MEIVFVWLKLENTFLHTYFLIIFGFREYIFKYLPTCVFKYLHESLAENMGYDTNNSTKIWGLIKGIQMDLDHNLTHLIIEEDSRVIIELAAKVINGKDSKNITLSWCLLGPLNSLKDILRPSLTLTTSHIRRRENKVADILSNAGVESSQHVTFIDTR
jgi:hypothetical protein